MQFLAAVAIKEALEEKAGVNVKLKWPNDLVLENLKLGGMLVESKTVGDNISFVILGIGVNVNQSKGQLPSGAVSLILSSGRRNDLRALLKTILDQIRSWYADLANPSAIMEEWWRNCVHRSLRVRIAMPSGSVTGVSTGIDEEGGLMLETEDHKIRKVSEGSLTLLDD